jgi:hypothetical protein
MLSIHLHRFQLGDAMGVLQGLDSVIGRKFAHDQCQLAVGCHVDGSGSTRCTYLGARVPPRFTSTTNVMFFIPYPFWENVIKAAVHFFEVDFEVEYTTAVKGLPHSKQVAFNRDVINPQDGHILCDPGPVINGFALRIRRSNRIMNSTISRPRKLLVAFIKRSFLATPAPN